VSGHQLPTDDGSLRAVLLRAVFIRPTTGLRQLHVTGCQQSPSCLVIYYAVCQKCRSNFDMHRLNRICRCLGRNVTKNVGNQKSFISAPHLSSASALPGKKLTATEILRSHLLTQIRYFFVLPAFNQ